MEVVNGYRIQDFLKILHHNLYVTFVTSLWL